jgi:hypothetical protein
MGIIVPLNRDFACFIRHASCFAQNGLYKYAARKSNRLQQKNALQVFEFPITESKFSNLVTESG